MLSGGVIAIPFTFLASPHSLLFFCVVVAFCPSSYPLLTSPRLPTLPSSQPLNLTLPPFATLSSFLEARRSHRLDETVELLLCLASANYP